MHAMLSNDYKRKVSCMAAGAPAAFCRTSRRGFASPQSAHSSLLCFAVTVLINSLVKKIQKIITFRTRHIQVVFIFIDQ